MRSRVDVGKWLYDSPPIYSHYIALRSALRVFPLVLELPREYPLEREFILTLFESLLTSSVGGRHDLEPASKAATLAVDARESADTILMRIGDVAACISEATTTAVYIARTHNHGATSAAATVGLAHQIIGDSLWDEIKFDRQQLENSDSIENVWGMPLWSGDPPFNIKKCYDFLPDFFPDLGQQWSVLTTWYDGWFTGDRESDFFFLIEDQVALNSSDFWNAEPDDVMAEIAERVGRVQTIDVDAQDVKILDFTPKNSAYDPAFRPVVPISRRLEAPAPIVVTDQAYFHRATLERLSTLQSMCVSGNQAVVSRLSKRLVAFQRELGPNSDGIYIKGVFTERRSLKRLVDAQIEIKDMSEAEREWQEPLWPVDVRTTAQDLCDIAQDLLDNDEQTKTLEQAPDDGALSEEDTKLPAAARALEQDLIEDVAEDLVDESVPSVIENYIDQADDAVRTTKPGEAPLDRPIGGLRGILLNLGNAIAEATLSALETAGTVTKKGGKWVVAAAASGYIGNTTIPWAIARLSALRDALATQAWDDVIAFLSNIPI